MSKKGLSFIKGAIAGALAGATAGVLFAPKSGKETRQDLKDKANELKEDAQSLYNQAHAALDRKVEEIKTVGKKIDKASYTNLIDEVVEEFKNTKQLSADAAKELGAQLRKDAEKVLNALKA